MGRFVSKIVCRGRIEYFAVINIEKDAGDFKEEGDLLTAFLHHDRISISS